MIYLELFWVFFQVGAFSIGGGYAAIPIIQSNVVEDKGWLSMTKFTDLITIAEMNSRTHCDKFRDVRGQSGGGHRRRTCGYGGLYSAVGVNSFASGVFVLQIPQSVFRKRHHRPFTSRHSGAYRLGRHRHTHFVAVGRRRLYHGYNGAQHSFGDNFLCLHVLFAQVQPQPHIRNYRVGRAGRGILSLAVKPSAEQKRNDF